MQDRNLCSVWVIEKDSKTSSFLKEKLGNHFPIKIFSSLEEIEKPFAQATRERNNVPNLLIADLKEQGGATAIQEFLCNILPALNSEREESQIKVDPSGFNAVRGDRISSRLTAREFQILYVLSSNNGILPREKILSKVWKDVSVESRTLDVHLSSLRQKLAPLRVEICQTADEQICLLHH